MKKSYLRKLILTAVFAALMCIIAPITIPTGLVPITLSLFAVFLCGAILPPLYALAASLVYIALGAVGLPVFSGFEGGLGKIVGPTGGFLWAYPLMVLVIALSIRVFRKRSILSLSVGILASIIICYVMGALWFSYLTGSSLAVLSFLPADLLKGAAAIALTLGLSRTNILRDL